MSENKKKKRMKIDACKSLGLLLLCLIFIVIILVFAFAKLIPKTDYYVVSPRVDNVKTTIIDNPNNPLTTVGWIQVQGTNIDYPIVLKEGEGSYPGDKTGYAWLSNFTAGFHNHIRVSGHNLFNLSSTPKMKSDMFERFESLMSFVYYDFAKENKYIQLTMDGKEYVYKVFATAFVPNNEKLWMPLDDDYKEEDLEQYIELMKKISIYDYDIDVNKDDDIISVITCTRFFGIDDRKDFRIVGRLVRDDEKINDYSVKRNRNYVQVEEKMKGDDVDDIDA